MTARRLAAALVLVLAAFGQGPGAPSKGAVEGVVLNQVTNEPVPKAQVTLSGRGPGTKVVTGADGRFSFRGLSPGDYYLMAARTGFLSPEDGWPPVKLGVNEEKTDVELALIPGASITGVVRNEYQRPIQGCSMNVWRMSWSRGAMRPMMQAGASTNDKGEYRVEQLQAGRYYLSAQCGQQLSLPHPLMDRDDPRIPYAMYTPQVYPGARDFHGAGAITLAAGAELRGANFDVVRTAAPGVYGHVTADHMAAGRDIQIILYPVDPGLQGWVQYFGGAQRDSGRFQIPAVLPGSYMLIAATSGEGPVCQTRTNLDVGSGPPQAVEVSLGCSEMKGSVEIQGESAPPPESLRITLEPLDLAGWWQQPAAQVGKDGRFSLAGVWPGRFRLHLGIPVWVKSLRIGGEEASPAGFTIKSGAGEMSLVASTAMGSMSVAVPGVSSGSGVTVVALPEDEAMLDAGQMRFVQGVGGNAGFELRLPPGRYRVFAVDSAGWRFTPQVQALWTVAQKRGQTVEVAEGERVTVAPEVVTAAELKRAVQELR